MMDFIDCSFYNLQATTTLDTKVPCALQLRAPDDVARVNNHFVLLLDVSGSMDDENKLENCKRCASLLLDFMTEQDQLSLITFGDEATVCIKAMHMDETNKQSARATIDHLVTNGSTNLSAGLACVDEVCQESALKTGLLLLTDGHANIGVFSVPALRQMITTLQERFTNLSVHCVAYGENHNADLLRSIAEDTQGAYNIVNSIEDAAFAFGETLGGLISCAYQNIVIEVPLGTVVHGPYKTIVTDTCMQIKVGDIYAGTKPLVLFDVPATSIQEDRVVKVKGYEMARLRAFEMNPILGLLQQRNADIDLTKLRYTCTDILKCIRDYNDLTTEQKEAIHNQIDSLASKLTDPFLTNKPVCKLLIKEIPILRNLLNTMRNSRPYETRDSHVLASQHLTTIGLSRGFSSPTNRGQRFRRQHALSVITQPYSNFQEEDENPVLYNESITGVEEEDVELNTTFQGRVQSQIASMMRTRSQQ